MRPPGFIVKSASDLCPNILLRIRFRFLFSTLFSRDTPPFPTRETRKCGYRCRLLAVGFSPFFAITRQMDLCSEFHRMGITAAFRTYCVLSKSARKQLFFILPLRLRYSHSFRFSPTLHLSLRAVRLDSDFASEKCANACEAREHPPSTQTPAQPSFSRRCCDIAGSVYGPRLSDIRRRVRRMRRSSRRGFLIFSANTRKTPTFKSLGMPDREVLIRDIRKYAR